MKKVHGDKRCICFSHELHLGNVLSGSPRTSSVQRIEKYVVHLFTVCLKLLKTANQQAVRLPLEEGKHCYQDICSGTGEKGNLQVTLSSYKYISHVQCKTLRKDLLHSE
jgi:hypothetical protein